MGTLVGEGRPEQEAAACTGGGRCKMMENLPNIAEDVLAGQS